MCRRPGKTAWLKGLPARLLAQSRQELPCYGRRLIEITERPTFSDAEAALLSDGDPVPYGTDHLDIAWAPKDHHGRFSEAGRPDAHAASLLIGVEADGVQHPGGWPRRCHRSPLAARTGHRCSSDPGDDWRHGDDQKTLCSAALRDLRFVFLPTIGWHRVGPEVSVEQEHERKTMPLLTCWSSVAQGCAVPLHRLRILGPPF